MRLCSLLLFFAVSLSVASAQESASRSAGLADRNTYELWSLGLLGPFKAGADFWAAHRSVPQEAKCTGWPMAKDKEWIQGCEAGQEHLRKADFQRKRDQEYRAGWNAWSPDGNNQNSNGETVTKENSQSEIVAYGNKAGEDAPVVFKSGQGTASAILKIDVGWREQVHYCEKQYEGDDTGATKRCVDSAKESFAGAKTLVASANCVNGNFVDFEGRHLRFNGERPQTFDGKTYYQPVLAYEGFELGTYSYIGASTSAGQFKSMCPAGRSLAQQLPELQIPSCLDKDISEEASKILVETGIRHIMNIKVFDIWDIVSDGNYWNESRCHAQISFNSGKDAVMEFKIYPRHGRFVLETRLR